MNKNAPLSLLKIAVEDGIRRTRLCTKNCAAIETGREADRTQTSGVADRTEGVAEQDDVERVALAQRRRSSRRCLGSYRPRELERVAEQLTWKK